MIPYKAKAGDSKIFQITRSFGSGFAIIFTTIPQKRPFAILNLKT